jgi:uncharacterized protein
MNTKTSTTWRPGADTPPMFRDLSPAECAALLARNSIGRLAFAFKSRVDVQPIHYAYANGRLFGRTSDGEKLLTLRHSPWVAFEVDEVAGTFDWCSVVVHGTFYRLAEDGSPAERHSWRQAIELLRIIVPLTGTRADPVPFRDVLFEIVFDTVTGREATSKGP